MANTAVDFVSFRVGQVGDSYPDSWLALTDLLKTISITPEVDLADGRAMASEYERNQPVKEGTKLDFTTFVPPATGTDAASNLSVTLWDIGTGSHFLADLRGGSINVTNPTKERSSIASLAKTPVFVGGTQIEVMTSKVIPANQAFFTGLLATLGTLANIELTVSISFAGQAFVAPMVIKSAVHKIDRGELQMEDVTLQLRGTPTGPAATTLLGAALFAQNRAFGIALDTGANSYTTALAGGVPSQFAVLERLNVTFADGALIEQTGTFALQGQLAVA